MHVNISIVTALFILESTNICGEITDRICSVLSDGFINVQLSVAAAKCNCRQSKENVYESIYNMKVCKYV